MAIRRSHETYTVKLRYAPEKKWLLSTGFDKKVMLFDSRMAFRCRRTLDFEFEGMIYVEYNVARNLLITGDYTNLVKFFKLDTFEFIDRIKLSSVWACHIQYLESKDIVFAYSSVDEISFYRWPTKKMYGKFKLQDRCNSNTILERPGQVIIPNDLGEMVFLNYNDDYLNWRESARKSYDGLDALNTAGADGWKYLLMVFTRGERN